MKLLNRNDERHIANAVIADPEEEAETPVAADEDNGGPGEENPVPLDEWRALWRGELADDEPRALLADAGFSDPETAARRLLTLRQSRQVQAMQRIGFDRLDALMPLLLAAVAESPWIAEQIARHPVLLDELLTPATLYSPADKTRLTDELRQALGRIPEDDEEAQLEALRIFKHAQVLHVAASDIAGARALMKVSY